MQSFMPHDGLMGYVGLCRWCKPYSLKIPPLSAPLTVQASTPEPPHGITPGFALC